MATPASINIQRVEEGIRIDGDLSDPAWSRSLRLEQFVEYWKSDNAAPPAPTTAFLAYDAEAVYVAFLAKDPAPGRIRAPFVDRDKVLADQDYVAVLIDTQNDRRSAIALRVNPRGIQTDSVVNDANGLEDFAPDFFYEAVARETHEGWTAEMRIPLSSLRYPQREAQSWGVLLMRNYPRDFRYIMASTPIPKNSPCFVCHASTMTGLEGLPTGAHYTLAPYSTAAREEQRRDGDLRSQPLRSDAGLDFKWNASTKLTVDATLNPDFSQIESDVPQLTVNSKFALSVPEKRTFFLEGVDLLSTPMKAVHTRSITSPAWGLRATGQSGSNAYTLLLAEDRGGGRLILPGAEGSSSVPQDFRSRVLIGRLRRSLGESFGAFLVSAREAEGGGHNRVLGPDFLWQISKTDRLVGQVLVSSTKSLPAGASEGYASRFTFTRDAKRYDLWTNYYDYSGGFRADNGFMPFAGGRGLYNEVGLRFYPKHFFSYVRPYLGTGLETTWRGVLPGVYFQGKWGSDGWITWHVRDSERVNGRMLDHSFADFTIRANPWRMLPALQIEGKLGERIDYAGGRVGRGGTLALSTTVRPTDHLQLEWKTSREWIDDVFSGQVSWLKTTYTFNARSLVRLIGQHGSVDRTGPKEGNFALSGLYGYRLNWQTTFFVGFGDAQLMDERGKYVPQSRSLFTKVSYAFQR